MSRGRLLPLSLMALGLAKVAVRSTLTLPRAMPSNSSSVRENRRLAWTAVALTMMVCGMGRVGKGEE